MSLYELTGGNYRVHRVVSFPGHPGSELVFDADVESVGETDWTTRIQVSGTYEGPTDVVSVRDYQLVWSREGDTLAEEGSATLVLSSGETVESEWTSSIETEAQRLAELPETGEEVQVTYSPFQIEGNVMSYEWEGTVRARSGEP